MKAGITGTRDRRSTRTAVGAAVTALAVVVAAGVAAEISLRAQSGGVAGSTVVRSMSGAVLTVTNHPRLPRDLSQLWLVPTAGGMRRSGGGPLVSAVDSIANGHYVPALALLADPVAAQGPLGAYVSYYTGVAQLRAGMAADARATFRALRELRPVGYLAQAAAVGEAESLESLKEYGAAADIYQRLLDLPTVATDDLLVRLGRAARLAGDPARAAAAFQRAYYEFPVGDVAVEAASELPVDANAPVEAGAADSPRYRLELGRAERLYAAKQYAQARGAFTGIRGSGMEQDRDFIRLRIAACDYYLKRYKQAREGARPLIDHGPRQSEALYFFAAASRGLKLDGEHLAAMHQLIDTFGEDVWAAEALSHLASYHLVKDEDDQADALFRELSDRFPTHRLSERALWKIGWRAYRQSSYAETVRYFERAAADFPRADFRPNWLYWAGRAHEQLGEQSLADHRYSLVATDYKNSYYGRLALRRLSGRPLLVPAVDTASGATATNGTNGDTRALPGNAVIVRALLDAELYDDALRELRFAQRVWGTTPAVEATVAWVLRQQSRMASGSRRFALLRGSVNTMRRAYPQFMAAGGEDLPRELQTVIFPLAYWDLIKKHADERGLDPYLVAALVAQESTFVADIKSSANAVGLMQLIPSTARGVARQLKTPYSPRLLTNPEANVRMGTTYLADKIKEFGDLHLVLASYNAGERVVYRWAAERQGVEQDEFIDDIPYPETQNYVKRILGTADDYRRLYSGEQESIDDVRPDPAVPASTVTSSVGARRPATTRRPTPQPPTSRTSRPKRGA